MYLLIVYHGVYFEARVNIEIKTFFIIKITAALLELNVPKVLFSFNISQFESGSRQFSSQSVPNQSFLCTSNV